MIPKTDDTRLMADCHPRLVLPSSTPETSEAWDAVSRKPDGMYDSRVPISEFAYAMSEHSKKMERQRDALKAAGVEIIEAARRSMPRKHGTIERNGKLFISENVRPLAPADN